MRGVVVAALEASDFALSGEGDTQEAGAGGGGTRRHRRQGHLAGKGPAVGGLLGDEALVIERELVEQDGMVIRLPGGGSDGKLALDGECEALMEGDGICGGILLGEGAAGIGEPGADGALADAELGSDGRRAQTFAVEGNGALAQGVRMGSAGGMGATGERAIGGDVRAQSGGSESSGWTDGEGRHGAGSFSTDGAAERHVVRFGKYRIYILVSATDRCRQSTSPVMGKGNPAV